MHSHQILQSVFKETSQVIGVTDTESAVFGKLYKLWIEKYCTARIKDRMAAMSLLEVTKSKRITNKTQNLRDDLKADHVKKSKK